MTRLVRCKEGMLRMKKIKKKERGNKNALTSRLRGIKNKWNRYHTAHGSASVKKKKNNRVPTACMLHQKQTHDKNEK